MAKEAFGVRNFTHIPCQINNVKFPFFTTSNNIDLFIYFLEIHVHCTGQPGHGSLLIPNTAGEKVNYFFNNNNI